MAHLNYRNMISIVIALLLIYSSTANAPCTPKFLLPSTIHDSIKIYSFNTSNSLTKAAYTYNYFQNLFNGQPKVIISINELVATQITQVNYQLTSQLQSNSVIFNFASKNMKWNSVQIQFLLYSGNDIFSNVETISISEVGANTIVEFNAQRSGKNNNPTFLFNHFIIGVVAASNKYQISLQALSIASDKYSIIASSNIPSTLTIQTIYFDSQQTAFSYAFNQFTLSGNQQPQYRTLWADFAPTVYTLFGFSMLSGSGADFSISADLDLVSNVFTIGNMKGISSAKMNYLAIGVLPSDVCSPCDSFISISGCLSACPNNSYAQNLNGGGKTCRFCNTNLGQTLNPYSNGCICANGMSYFKGNCYRQAELPPSCSNGQLLINNQCVSTNSKALCPQQYEYYDAISSSCQCMTSYERVQGTCLQSCPSNSNRDPNTGICVCFAGFLINGLNKCVSICPSNAAYDSPSASCLCNPNYQMVNGVCQPCRQSQAYDPTSRTCVAKFVGKVGASASVVTVVCQPNQVIVNNACQCDQNSIKVGGRCTPCPATTFKADDGRYCDKCIPYCKICTSSSSCTECSAGFKFIGQQCEQVCGDGKKYILPCDDGNTKSGDGCSSTCQIQSGYACNGGNANHPDKCSRLRPNTKMSIAITPYSPTYTTPGIITDFIVNPPIRRTQEELHNMFSISFSNSRARPKHLSISQSDSDLTSIRCFFGYNSDLPNDIFTATFIIRDETYGKDNIRIMYNSLVNPVKSAISFMEGLEDDVLK